MKVGETVKLNITLENTSNIDGDEVVQVYIKNKNDKDGPIKSLRTFKRVNVPAKKTTHFSIELPSKAFETYYDDVEHLDIRPGEYSVYVGGSSAETDLIVASLTIK